MIRPILNVLPGLRMTFWSVAPFARPSTSPSAEMNATSWGSIWSSSSPQLTLRSHVRASGISGTSCSSTGSSSVSTSSSVSMSTSQFSAESIVFMTRMTSSGFTSRNARPFVWSRCAGGATPNGSTWLDAHADDERRRPAAVRLEVGAGEVAAVGDEDARLRRRVLLRRALERDVVVRAAVVAADELAQLAEQERLVGALAALADLLRREDLVDERPELDGPDHLADVARLGDQEIDRVAAQLVGVLAPHGERVVDDDLDVRDGLAAGGELLGDARVGRRRRGLRRLRPEDEVDRPRVDVGRARDEVADLVAVEVADAGDRPQPRGGLRAGEAVAAVAQAGEVDVRGHRVAEEHVGRAGVRAAEGVGVGRDDAELAQAVAVDVVDRGDRRAEAVAGVAPSMRKPGPARAGADRLGRRPAADDVDGAGARRAGCGRRRAAPTPMSGTPSPVRSPRPVTVRPKKPSWSPPRIGYPASPRASSSHGAAGRAAEDDVDRARAGVGPRRGERRADEHLAAAVAVEVAHAADAEAGAPAGRAVEPQPAFPERVEVDHVAGDRLREDHEGRAGVAAVGGVRALGADDHLGPPVAVHVGHGADAGARAVVRRLRREPHDAGRAARVELRGARAAEDDVGRAGPRLGLALAAERLADPVAVRVDRRADDHVGQAVAVDVARRRDGAAEAVAGLRAGQPHAARAQLAEVLGQALGGAEDDVGGAGVGARRRVEVRAPRSGGRARRRR